MCVCVLVVVGLLVFAKAFSSCRPFVFEDVSVGLS